MESREEEGGTSSSQPAARQHRGTFMEWPSSGLWTLSGRWGGGSLEKWRAFNLFWAIHAINGASIPGL